MMKNKKSLLMLIMIILTALFFPTDCVYDISDGMTRVTINLNRTDLAYTKSENLLVEIIDKVLMFFANPAHAVVTNWVATQGTITLTITGTDMDDISIVIPPGTTSFSTEIPAGPARVFTVYSRINTTGPPAVIGYKNWGGRTTSQLVAGESTTINITMIPMTHLYSVTPGGTGTLTLNFDAVDTAPASSASLLFIYRSTQADGPFTLVSNSTNITVTNSANDIGLTSGSTFYYKVSVSGAFGEGLQTEVVSGVAP